MKFHTRLTISHVAAILIFLSHPIASWSQTPGRDQLPSGNAPSTATWTTTKHKKHLVIRVNPDADLSMYNRIAVGTVTYTGPAKKLKLQESAKMTSLLRDSLTKDLSAATLSADNSAAESLTLNAEITDVKRVHPWVNVLTMAAVFVPLDFGGAKVTAQVVDQQTRQVIVEIQTVGCGQVYEAFASLQPLGQSRLALKKNSRSIAKEVGRINWSQHPTISKASEMSVSK
jgi:hypothetical protein